MCYRELPQAKGKILELARNNHRSPLNVVFDRLSFSFHVAGKREITAEPVAKQLPSNENVGYSL